MSLKCAAHGCEFTRLAMNTSGFCPEHEQVLAHDEHELEQDLAKVLRLEAEFQSWCRDRGLPDPHDK